MTDQYETTDLLTIRCITCDGDCFVLPSGVKEPRYPDRDALPDIPGAYAAELAKYDATLVELKTLMCPTCDGTGWVRLPVEILSIQVYT